MHIIKTEHKNCKLHYDINALCAVEAVSGKQIDEVLGELESKPGMSAVRMVLYAGLQGHHEDEVPTEKAAGQVLQAALIHHGDFNSVASVVFDAIRAGLSPLEQAAGGKGQTIPASARGTGNESQNSSDTQA